MAWRRSCACSRSVPTPSIELGPAEGATRGRYQALRVDLPNITRTIVPFPVDGNDPNYFYSGQGDNLDNTQTKSFAAAAATPISFRAMWDIETDWDYAYLMAQVGGVWQTVQTSASRTTNPNGQNFGFGISGSSRNWTNVTATLPAGTTALRLPLLDRWRLSSGRGLRLIPSRVGGVDRQRDHAPPAGRSAGSSGSQTVCIRRCSSTTTWPSRAATSSTTPACVAHTTSSSATGSRSSAMHQGC